jgi:beta-phosphoglucomutase family hydrolase
MTHPHLPASIDACLFDLDGVLTDTARVHLAAWTEMFDAFLEERGDSRPFSTDDYRQYVDGRLREDGVRAFLASRQIELPEGSDRDPPAANTIHGLATRKNDLVQAVMARDGITVYPGSVRFVDAARNAGLRIAVVSASKNTAAALETAGIADRFEVRVDGIVAAERHLPGKPAPDTYLAAAEALGQSPGRCAVFEDAVSGVEAGRAGQFGYVVGVDRTGHAGDLAAAGADIVVTDLAQLLEDR